MIHHILYALLCSGCMGACVVCLIANQLLSGFGIECRLKTQPYGGCCWFDDVWECDGMKERISLGGIDSGILVSLPISREP